MISAIILSAGEGKRIGFNKALLDWGGEKLINYQIKSLSHKDITERIVVIGSESEKVRKIVEWQGSHWPWRPKDLSTSRRSFLTKRHYHVRFISVGCLA